MCYCVKKRSFISQGLIFFIIFLLGVSTAFAVNKEKQFVPEETYKFLFFEGLSIIKSNITGQVRMGNKGYTCQPRLKSSSRPSCVEYTTFCFDGYWERRPWERTSLGGRFWDRRHKKDKETDMIPGRWFFKVKWTTRTKQTTNLGLLTIIDFEEVLPEVFFIKYGLDQERYDFKIEKRFPDKEHKRRGYVNGKFGIFKQMD